MSSNIEFQNLEENMYMRCIDIFLILSEHSCLKIHEDEALIYAT